MTSKEERAQIGFTMFMDIFEGRYLFAQLVAEGAASNEIRLAIFFALNGRYADPENLDDALLVFGFDITHAHDLIKAKAALYMQGGPVVSRNGLNFDALTQVAVAMKKMADIPATMQNKIHRRQNHATQIQAENRTMVRRDTFNSQHKQAPEGTVKELAARYGKSLGEIRRLKSEGKLDTLTLDQGEV